MISSACSAAELDESDCDVIVTMVAIMRGKHWSMVRVLVAVDDSDVSVHAAQIALGLFGDSSEYLALNVAPESIEPPAGWVAGWGARAPIPYGSVWPYTARVRPSTANEPWDVPPFELAQSRAEQVAERAGLPSPEIEADVGDPVQAIVEAAERLDVDVIVVGHHERGWLDRLLHQSVSENVAREARVPVLLVR